MKCSVCGQSYGVSHECPGAAQPLAEEMTPAPSGFVPLHYFREAVKIARWDDVAIRRTSRDRKALLYGALFFFLAFALLSLNSAFPRIQAGSLSWAEFAFRFLLLFLLALFLTFAHYGVCHLLARWLFRATGSYLGVVRPLLLGTIVQWLAVIPVVGALIANLWSLAVFMFVLEEADGIERLQAFGIGFVVGIAFLAVRGYISSFG